MIENGSRWRAVGGVVGPAAFVGTWATLGLRKVGYSPIDDPISRLAAVDASTRWAMSAGLVAFGAGVSLYAAELAVAVPGKAAAAAATTAAATIGIALTPLGSAVGGTAHAIAAGLAYSGLAATPVLAAKTLAAQGRTTAAKASTLAGVATAALLLASVASPSRTGLLQRVGLTIGDAWIVASACLLVRPHDR